MPVTITLNGRPFKAGDFQAVLERAAVEAVHAKLTKRIEGLRCAQHGRGPFVVASGDSLKNIAFQVSACCEDLRAATLKALGTGTR